MPTGVALSVAGSPKGKGATLGADIGLLHCHHCWTTPSWTRHKFHTRTEGTWRAVGAEDSMPCPLVSLSQTQGAPRGKEPPSELISEFALSPLLGHPQLDSP